MFLGFVVSITCLLTGASSIDEMTIRISNQNKVVKSIQIASPLKAYFPGAIGVSILSTKRNRVDEVRPSLSWNRLVEESVQSLHPIDTENLRIRIVLNDEQILVDANGRFIRKRVDVNDFETWNGETREMRSSQYVSIFGELEKLKP